MAKVEDGPVAGVSSALLSPGDLPTRFPLTSASSSRFYLGGPTSVRGFSMHSVGPQSEGLSFPSVPQTERPKLGA